MYARNMGYALPLQFGGPKPRLRNSTATLAAYNFGIKHDIHYRQVHYKLKMVSYIVSKSQELWCTNGLNLESHFTHHPQILHSTSLLGLADGYQQTELNQTLPNGQ